MAQIEDLENRIRKNAKGLKSWAKVKAYECFRVYDRDIPEFPYIIDRYGDHAVIWCQAHRDRVLPEPELVQAAVATALSLLPTSCVYKTRERMVGTSQYEKLSSEACFFNVGEGALSFRVNLNDYLDTGLFLDTRTIRQTMIPPAAGDAWFLNLFAYTGTLSVAAAAKGYRTVTVDLSQTYLAWAKENFLLNGLDLRPHGFVHMDAREYVTRHQNGSELYDLIYLDPPTFSNSKRMDGTFDVQRDHVALIRASVRWLAKKGRLLFVTNCRGFKLDPLLSNEFAIEDLSARTVPRDMARHRPHRCFAIERLQGTGRAP